MTNPVEFPRYDPEHPSGPTYKVLSLLVSAPKESAENFETGEMYPPLFPIEGEAGKLERLLNTLPNGTKLVNIVSVPDGRGAAAVLIVTESTADPMPATDSAIGVT